MFHPTRAGRLRLAGALTALVAAVSVAGPAQAATVSFAPVADTYASVQSPTTAHGTLRYARYAPSRKTYLRFDVRGLSAPVTRATLSLYALTGSGTSAVSARRVADNRWAESTLTQLWNVDEGAHPWYAGENDFWETGGNHADWNSFVHYRDAASQVSCTHREPDGRLSDATVWHDVALEWEADRMQVFVDGYAESSCRWTDPAVIPDRPQRLTFQLDALDADLGDTIVRMEIDRAAIYRRSTF